MTLGYLVFSCIVKQNLWTGQHCARTARWHFATSLLQTDRRVCSSYETEAVVLDVATAAATTHKHPPHK